MSSIFDPLGPLNAEALPGTRRLRVLAELAPAPRDVQKELDDFRFKPHDLSEKSTAPKLFKVKPGQSVTVRFLDNSRHELDITSNVLSAKTDRNQSWQTSVAGWHKGLPPHDGIWKIKHAEGGKEYFARFKSGKWLTGHIFHQMARETVIQSIDQGGQRLWFGHAPDSDGWIRWNDVPGGDWKDASPIYELRNRQVVVRFTANCILKCRANCVHGFQSGEVMAYKLL